MIVTQPASVWTKYIKKYLYFYYYCLSNCTLSIAVTKIDDRDYGHATLTWSNIKVIILYNVCSVI